MLGAAATLMAVRDGSTFFYRFEDAMHPFPVVPFERRILDQQEMTYLQELERRLQAFARDRIGYQYVLALLRQRTKLYFPPHTERASPIYEGLRQVLETRQALTIETNDLMFGFDLTVIANQVLGLAVPVTYKLLAPFPHPPQALSPQRGRQRAVLLIANPSANPALRGTEEEVAALHGRYTQAGVRTSVLTGKRVNLSRIAQAFANTEAMLLYIAGEFNEEGIPLADGETLRPEHILRYVECRDITVILNGCSFTCRLAPCPFCGAARLLLLGPAAISRTTQRVVLVGRCWRSLPRELLQATGFMRSRYSIMDAIQMMPVRCSITCMLLPTYATAPKTSSL